MKSVLLILVIFLSACQTVNDNSKKLSSFKPKVNESFQIKNENETELWRLIATNQQINSEINLRIQSQINRIERNPKYLSVISKRAEPYLYLVVSELEKQGLPIEIALLPIVESDYYPFSYSHGTAVGLWQFIPSTGKMYGLKESWWHEDRRGVLASTQAAAKYLKDLNKMFDGDWLLAIAAYNAGPGRIQRAIDKNIKLGLKTDYWSLDLPNETEKYVPKLLALAEVIKNPSNYNQSLFKINNEPFLKEIELNSQFDLALIAQWTGLTIDQIYTFNPGLRRWATPVALPYTILLPIKVVNDFDRNLAKFGKRPTVSWARHKIKKGDSLSFIATKYNTTILQIQSVNKLTTDIIRIGDYLIVPLAEQDENYYSLSENQRVKSRLNIQKNSEKINYKVISGDSLWKIAKKYNTSVNNLVKWNQIVPSEALLIGKELVILINNKSKTDQVKIINTGININKKIVYTVKIGDNLSRIANKYQVKVGDIQFWNGLNEGHILQPGDKLTITINVVNSNLS